MKQRIWFITGISSGLGKALAEAVMDNGDFVIGTFRSQIQADVFNNLHKDDAFAINLDIANVADLHRAVEGIHQKFGRIDVLVNNAGFGFAGAIEETSLEEAKSVFETNFFAALQITQAFLPQFRQQKSGHIIQISSHGGFKAFPGFGIYNASKFALEGFSEALAIEVAPFGIKLTIVEPGPFRTNFAGKSFKLAEQIIEDYQQTAGAFRERMSLINGKQEGDPGKAANAIVEITKLDTPPLRLPLGKIAIISLTSKIESVREDIDRFKHIAESVVY